MRVSLSFVHSHVTIHLIISFFELLATTSTRVVCIINSAAGFGRRPRDAIDNMLVFV